MSRPDTANPWLTVAEAAALIECSETMLRKLCRKHDIRHQRLGGFYRFRESWVMAFLDDATRGPEPAAPQLS